MITILTTSIANKVALTLREKSSTTLPYTYTFTATNIQTNEAISFALTDISLYPTRYNLFTIDGTLFDENEYIYSVQQNGGSIVETGKLLAYKDNITDVFFELGT